MARITKQTAATLYAYDYKLQDKEGNVYEILSCSKYGFGIKNIKHRKVFSICYFNQLGTDYKILCRPLDLTKEIKGIGVPIVELNKLYSESGEYTIKVTSDGKDGGWFIEDNTGASMVYPSVMINVFAWLDKNRFLRGVSEDCLIYIE